MSEPDQDCPSPQECRSPHDCRCHFHPTPEEVADLIARAKEHELGIEFLWSGSQDAVAAAFDVHAFTVDAARKELEEQGMSGESKGGSAGG